MMRGITELYGMWQTTPHTYRKDKCHEGMQGEQKSTTHSEPWYRVTQKNWNF